LCYPATQAANTTPFQVHADMAPAFYLDGNPAADAAVTRQFERDVGSLTALNPITGQTDRLSDKLVDRVGMGPVHMLTGDPLRTPTLVDFLDDDYFGFTGAANCTSPCVTAPGSWSHATFAWNHGGYTPDIVRIWAGLVGPGVRHRRDDPTWVDHTDLRPTILTLSGLGDDYGHDGRVITEVLDAQAVPQSLRAHRATLERLGAAYKQINAPLGRFGLDVIRINDARGQEHGPSTVRGVVRHAPAARRRPQPDRGSHADDLGAGRVRERVDRRAGGEAADRAGGGAARARRRPGRIVLAPVRAHGRAPPAPPPWTQAAEHRAGGCRRQHRSA
jgi:hypothetical protein